MSAFTHALSTNNYGPSKWIVDSNPANGTNTTIASAIAAASSGDTIFIRPGTYTENLALKAGVNLTAYGSDGITGNNSSGNVVIIGKCTASFAGTCSLCGITLRTNSDFCLEVSGSSATFVNLINCFILAANNTAINYTSSGLSKLELWYSRGECLTTGISIFTNSSTGGLKFFSCIIENSAGSTTASTTSAGGVTILNSLFSYPITSSGTSSIIFKDSILGGILTIGGSGSNLISECEILGGSNSAISIGTGSLLTITNSTISSSNTNAITGLGSISYTNLSYSLTSSTINTTTQTILFTGPSETIGSINVGNINTLTVTNSDNTNASSGALIKALTGGASAGDAAFQASTTTTSWSFGVDNSITTPTADTFVIAQGTALGTNNIMSVATSGEINYPLQPAFLAYLNVDVTNATGDGTNYTVVFDTEVFDQNSDFNGTTTFTAPVTGRYYIAINVRFEAYVAANTAYISIVTSNRSYRFMENTLGTYGFPAAASAGYIGTALTDMDAGDIATVVVTVNGGTKTVTVGGSSVLLTSFSGNLVC